MTPRRFSPEAQELFDAWLDNLMTRLRSSKFDTAPAFQAHLAKYPSLMPKLALVFHLIDEASGKAPGPISAEAANLAVNWCRFLEMHARKVYAAEINHEAAAAHLLAEKVSQGDVQDGQRVRDIYRHQWPGLKTAEQVGAALAVLEAHHWLKVVKTGEEGRGRPAEIIRLNPKAGVSEHV